MKQNSFKSFTDLYPLSKTLRFELRPIGKTDEHIKKNGLIDEDTIRAENFKKAKKIIDRYHKTFIDEVLSEYKIPTEDLEKYAEFYKDTSADSEKFKALKDSMRKGISKAFTQHIKYKKLDDWESIVKDLTNSGLKEDLAIIDKFKNFTTYFKGFQKNRKNMYTDKAQTTGIANRLIEENLPIFINNLRVFEKIKEKLKKELSKIPSELSLPQGVSNLDNLFCLNGYNALLTQKGITDYNTIIGGKTTNKGTKIKGISEYINLYNQTQKNEKSRLPEIRNLKKQILSPIKTPSFIPEAFKEDQEVFKAILEIYEQFKENILPKEGASLRKLLTTLDEYDLDGVFVPQDKIGYLSSRLFGNRETLSEALKAHFEQEQAQKKTAKGRRKKKISGEEYYDKLTHVSVAHLDKVAQNIINEKIQDLGIKNENGLQALLKHELTKEGNLFDKVINAFEKGITVSIQNNTKSFPAIIELSKCYEQTNNKKETTKLIEDTEAATALKTAMDCLKSVQYFCYNLRLKKDIAEQDHLFYSKFSKYDTLFQDLNLVHDKVRNYLTQKPYSLDKIKLNFNNSTLLSGWDVSKEETYHGVILRKDGNYYLGIINPKHKRIFNQKFILKQNEKVWEKMNYAQIDDKSITSLMVINGETKCIKKDLD